MFDNEQTSSLGIHIFAPATGASSGLATDVTLTILDDYEVVCYRNTKFASNPKEHDACLSATSAARGVANYGFK